MPPNPLIEFHEQTAWSLRRSFKDLPGLNPDDPLFPVEEWGIRVKTTPYAWVYITRMMFNWRVLEVIPDGLPEGHPLYPAMFYNRSWCFKSLAVALARAAAWDGRHDTEPGGWIKSVVDGRREGEPTEGIAQM